MTTTIATITAKNKEKIAVKLKPVSSDRSDRYHQMEPGAVRITELCSVAVATIAEITKKPAFKCVVSRRPLILESILILY